MDGCEWVCTLNTPPSPSLSDNEAYAQTQTHIKKVQQTTQLQQQQHNFTRAHTTNAHTVY